MAKYEPLFEHLRQAGDVSIEMSFDEIGRLVGGLPASATRHSPWWSNDTYGRHVQAQAWIKAGRQVIAVDRERRTVKFSAPKWTRGS